MESVGIPQSVLMENAGRSAALVLRRLFTSNRVVGLVGAGNNGGDALVALRCLAAWGCDVTGVLVGDRPSDDPLLHGWPIRLLSAEQLDDAGWTELWIDVDAVVDGVLGTGVRGAPRAHAAHAIDQLNAAGLPVLALDVPSGIDASTGAVPGAAVRADVTVSFGAPKLGALLHPARALVGRHVTAEIGFPPLRSSDSSATVITPGWARSRFPIRNSDTHKNRVGRVLLVGGGVGMAGAVVLAGRSAFRAGAGLVRVCTVEGNREVVQTALPEAIHVGTEGRALEEAVSASDAVAVGPGMGLDRNAALLLQRVVSAGDSPLILDADALTLASQGVIDLATVSERRPVLITPHPGEMARLLGDADGEDRLATLRSAVERFGCAVLLKGAPSVVGAGRDVLLVDTQSSSDLAVAGMGDTLTGVCATMLALGSEAPAAGALGLYLSGRAAVLADRGVGLIPSDVVEHIPDVFAESGAEWTDLDLPFVLFDADPAR
jgi:NAD(P)H-hydrate epimerase